MQYITIRYTARPKQYPTHQGLTRLGSVPGMRYNQAVTTYGALAEWLRSGLQNRVHRFKSGRCLQDSFVIEEKGKWLMPPEASSPPPVNKPVTPRRRRTAAIVVGVIGGLLLLLVIAGLAWWYWPSSPADVAGSHRRITPAEQKLYRALGQAARQQRLRLSMYRATWPTSSAADTGINPVGEASTISEIDTAAKDYRSLYAYRYAGDAHFTMGRCLGRQDYRNFDPEAQRPTSLAGAAANLGRIQWATQDLAFSPCPRLGLYPAGLPDVASARLSDGFFPVTLTDRQADNWVQQVSQAALFNVKDEGHVTFEGRHLRKLSFTPKSGRVGVTNQRLFDIFESAGEIEQIKRDHPDGQYLYEWISIGTLRHGDIAGYYLIDEATGLPVYSQLQGLAPDRASGSGSSQAIGSNVARTKQRYSFGAPLTLTADTPLDLLP